MKDEQKTKSTLNWCSEKKEKKGKIVYIEQIEFLNLVKLVLFLRKSLF